MLAARQTSQVLRKSVLRLQQMSRSNFSISSVGLLQPTKLLTNTSRFTSANSKFGCIPYLMPNKVTLKDLKDESLLEKFKQRAENILSQLMYYERGCLYCLAPSWNKNLEEMVAEVETNKSSKLLDAEESEYPKILATFYVTCKIETMGRILLDENVVDNRIMFYYVNTNDKVSAIMEGKYQECWMALLKSSKSPLAVELRTKLEEADFTNLDFAYAIAKVYYLVLNRYKYSFWRSVPYGPNDIIGVLKSLELSNTELECAKILLSLNP